MPTSLIAGGTTEAQASNHPGRGDRVVSRFPGSDDRETKAVVQGPGRFIPEVPSFRDKSRDLSQKRNMVGSVPSDRG
jgi:hypothetical protein